MRLADWLTQEKISYADFARRLKVADAKVVERYAKGTRMPKPAVMSRIVTLTGGIVQPNDFYPAAPDGAEHAGVEAA